MKKSTLFYAKSYIDIIVKEYGIKTFISDGRLYIELSSGKNLELSEDEIKYQAIEYLKDEISQI